MYLSEKDGEELDRVMTGAVLVIELLLKHYLDRRDGHEDEVTRSAQSVIEELKSFLR